MSDIDKDIEKLKALKYISISGHFYGQFMRAELPEEDKQAIENVLADRETWKKIAEKLADTLSYKLLETLGIKPRIEDLIESYRKEVEKDGKKRDMDM